jgi:hypothetical protein
MLTLDEVNERGPRCRRCKGEFRVALPPEWHASNRLASLVENRVQLIALLRQTTQCKLVDAKGTALHVARTAGICHWCDAVIPTSEWIVDCPACRALNIQFASVP